MEKENIKENEIKSEVEETTEAETYVKNQEVKEENTELISDEENNENLTENSSMQVILANILDEVLLVAVSAVLVLLCNIVLKLFGYMFVEGTGAIVVAAGVIYFILNCLYAPIIEKTKMKNTIAKKILDIK